MNPPPVPPPPIQELFALPTLNVMIILTFVMQVFIIGMNATQSPKQQYKGIWALFFSALLLMFHYLLILLLNVLHVIDLPAQWMQGLREIFNVAGHILIYIAVCQFVGIYFDRWVLTTLVPIVVLVGFIPGPPLARPLALAIIVGLDLVSVWVLLRVQNASYRIGALLTAFPLVLYAAATLTRLLLITSDTIPPGSSGQPTGPSVLAIFELLTLFAMSFLWTSAFIFMVSQRLHSDLNDLAMKDMLTRVRNRRAMQGLLNFEMARMQRDVMDFSVILLDIDHFKRVNDTYGHDAGDFVLKWVAQTMQAYIRAHDVVARWGGEEFLVLLPSTRLDEALEVADRLRQTIETSTAPNPTHPIKITFSGGVACSHGYRSVEEICKAADLALYRAKESGRNRVLPEEPHELNDKVASIAL